MNPAIDVSVRNATVPDLPFVLAAHENAHQAIQDARGGELDTLLHGNLDAPEGHWEAYLEHDRRFLLIGELDQVAVGYAAFEIVELSNGTSLATITDLWVHERARGVGVGYALMAQIEHTAIARGARGLDSRALPGDRATKNCYESFGLVARAIHVHRAL